MRPDEHKKKKNAAYKKKHGIGQTKGDGEDHGKGKKTGSEKHTSKFNIKPASAADGRHSSSVPQKKEQSETELRSSDVEGAEAKAPRKTFQRRQIVSNWQKYELQPEENDEPEMRGEHFDKLLSMAGDAVAHFRFKDEQGWEMDESGHCEPTDRLGQHFLSLDTNQIGQAMACLPIHTILGLPTDIFPGEELASIESAVSEQRQMYSLSHPTHSSPCQAQMAESSKKTGSDSILSSSNTTRASLGEPSQMVQRSERAHPLPGSSQQILGTVPSHDTQSGITGESKVLAQDVSTKLSLKDEDLDSLLDLDNPVESHAAGSVSSNSEHGTLEAVDESLASKHDIRTMADKTATSVTAGLLSLNDDDLDSLLDPPGTAMVGQSGNHIGAPQLQPSRTMNTVKLQSLGKVDSLENPKKDGVDLEDWLDSILDD